MCEKVLDDLGFRNFKSSNGHGDVIGYLSNSKDNELKKMGGYLGTLRSVRNTAAMISMILLRKKQTTSSCTYCKLVW